MMRRAKRSPVRQFTARQRASDGMDHRHFQQFTRLERGQNRGQTRRQHTLAGARRAAHQQIVATRSGNLQRPLGAFLPLDVAQIRRGQTLRPNGRCRARHDLCALEMIG